jgi:hypothetical protein
VDTDQTSNPSSTVTAGISRRAALGRLAGAGVAAALLTAARPAAGLAQATPGAARRSANHFVLGKGELQIVYDTTSFAGEPQLSYRGPIGSGPLAERPIDSVTIVGDEIHTEQVPNLGELVTVYLDAMPDAATFYLTLLLPEFNRMSLEAAPVPFSTLAILTTQLTSIAGPALIEGALQEYAVIEFEGTAGLVVT